MNQPKPTNEKVSAPETRTIAGDPRAPQDYCGGISLKAALEQDRDLWQTKAENWQRLAESKLKVIQELRAVLREIARHAQSESNGRDKLNYIAQIADAALEEEAR